MNGIIWLCLLVSLLLMAIRAYWAISLSEPLFVITSGAEEDSLLGFWKYIKDRPVFEDPHRFPFVGSAYNWLYYAFYGTAIDITLNALLLEIEWLPTIGRFVSLAWAFAGVIAAVTFFNSFVERGSEYRPLILPYSIFLFFGPLVGFWAISHNVELAATVLGIIGSLMFCRIYGNSPLKATIVACVFGYLAWSFKQSHIFIVLTLALFMFIRGDWRSLALVFFLNGLGWSAAIIGGSEAYVKMLFQKGVDKTLELSRLWINLKNFSLKSTPIIFFLTSIAIGIRDPRSFFQKIRNDDYALFSVCGLVVSIVISIPFSAKQGASENYYFVMSFYMLFAAFAVNAVWPLSGTVRRAANLIILLGWFASGVAATSVLAGYNGIVSTRNWHEINIAQRDCSRDMPEPVLPVVHTFLSLPWLVKSEPQFNLFYNYSRERAAGYWFEGGGVAGLIKKGYFGSILMPAGAKPEFDSVSLITHYELRKENCAGIDFYLKRGSG